MSDRQGRDGKGYFCTSYAESAREFGVEWHAGWMIEGVRIVVGEWCMDSRETRNEDFQYLRNICTELMGQKRRGVNLPSLALFCPKGRDVGPLDTYDYHEEPRFKIDRLMTNLMLSRFT